MKTNKPKLRQVREAIQRIGERNFQYVALFLRFAQDGYRYLGAFDYYAR